MSQWGQPGFQYPTQTGFPGVQPQFQPAQQLNPAPSFQQPQSGFGIQPGAQGFGVGPGGISSQPTGFPGARPQGLQQTNFPATQGVGPGFLQTQPTGFPGVQSSFQQHLAPPIPPLPTSYQQKAHPPPPPLPQQHSAFLSVNQSRLGGPSVPSLGTPGLVAQPTGVGLLSQPTGFAGRAPAPLVPQVTGFVDPRLQLMSSSFMPANVSAPYTSGGAPQLAPLPQQQLGGLSLQQSFQQHNQAHGKGATPKIPWALSKAEKKQYDQIFRAWDAQGTGFINGQTALEVFGQSGLDRNDLARIWTLADADNRGKLNLAEFHVAMGLIYRRLNGNDIPDELPLELVPPSSRDLDTSVNFLKDILKNDSRARSPSGLDVPVSRLKERSFTSSSSFTQQGGRQDATVYKHEDVEPPGGFYQPRNRHVDRSTIRSRADDASPATSDLSSIKRQLLNTQKMLDDTLANERSSDVLDRELEDLRYRISRLQEDFEYASKGPRTTAKEEERRRLERELVRLMHEEVPELEKKVEEREARREREKREWTRDRDRRNERSGRFGGEESSRYSPASKYREEEERPYSRGAPRYDRDDRDHDGDRLYRGDDKDRNRDVNIVHENDDRDRAPPTIGRSPPPPPPPASSVSQQRPPSAPARSPAPSMKKMTTEERQAFIQAEAQRRLEARRQALGIVTPLSASVTSPTLDTTIEDRLAQEKKEAEEKAREAERQAEEREKQRREKLEAEKASKGGPTSLPTPTTTAPPPAPAAAPVPTRATPHPPKPRPTPPPPRRGLSRASAAPTLSRPPAPPAPAPPPARSASSPTVPPAPVVVPNEDSEDTALRAREEALRKRREEHAALLRKLEEEEEEARKAEAAYQERRNQFLATKTSPAVATTPVISAIPPPPPAPPALSVSPPIQVAEPAEEAVPPPPPPPPLPPSVQPTSVSVTDKPSNNPFSRLMKGGASAPAPPPTTTTNGSSNPFFRPQTAPPAAPPPPKSPGIPPPVKTAYHTAPKDSDDDWDDVMEKEEDNSSDEELGTRDTRMGLAQQLFGNLLPSRPQSAGPAPSSSSPVSPVAPPPASAPPAPAPPSVPIASPAPTGDRGALLSAIQGGARLRKTVTNDRSGAATSGKVVSDDAPPAHINASASPLSPPAPPSASFAASPLSAEVLAVPLTGQSASLRHEKKESIDWYNALAADVDKREVDRLPVTTEEHEEEEAPVQISDHAPDHASELMTDVDLSTKIRVRSLYPYEGQRAEDLGFAANMVIIAHPSKSGGDWWYGTAINSGKVGFFPQTYVQKVEQVHATAMYAYESTNEDELAFNEGDILIIVDRSEIDWWKAERNGLVFIVPAAYLELIEDFALGISGQARPGLELNEGQVLQANRASFYGDHHARATDVYSTPYATPRDTYRPELRRTSSTDGDEDDEEDAYYSLDEEGTSESAQEHDPMDMQETVTRESERQRVLQAAGLVVSPLARKEGDEECLSVHTPSKTVFEAHEHICIPSAPELSAVTRSKSTSGSASESPRRRRPAPAVPQRGLTHISTKNLPSIPTIDLQWTDTSSHAPFGSSDTTADKEVLTEMGMGHFKTTSDGSIIRPDDAFERYETFKKMQASHGHSPLACAPPTSASVSRMSMSSFDTGSLAPTSPPRSPATSVTPSEREREGGNGGAGGESRTSQFLSFLGRHTHTRASTPENPERERKLVISGPIPHTSTPSFATMPLVGGENGGPTREGSPVFGSSWASLVDRSALEGIPKQERKRQEAIFELISTEADYVRDVQLIVELFYSRLIQVLDEKATEMIFLNIEDILLINTTFLSTLEERQRDCRLYIDHIGDLLEKHMPNMGVYLNYCVNQANAGKNLQQMRETNPALALQLQNLREDPSARNLDLSSYLLVPMQRLTRYPLLIRQIMHYTPDAASGTLGPPLPSSPPGGDAIERRAIFAALQTAEGILGDVNETIRDREGRERLEEVSRTLWIGQGRLDLTAPTRHLGPRKLLKEGVLSKARSGRRLQVLLCSDILVLVNDAEKGLYRVPIPIHEIQVKPSRSGREDPLIRLHVAYPRGGDTILLRASSIREAKAWGDAILDTSKKALEGIRNVVRKPGEM